MSKRKVLHMIGNAHLDPVWLWRWQEGFEAARATRCAFRLTRPAQDWESDFAPCEIKTFLVTEDGVKETDLLETQRPS